MGSYKDQELKVQLSNPAQLDKIDKLRDLGVHDYVALPQLVVVGDQSSGKSSVLEAVMELPLPRDSGLCTRFATNITFRRGPKTSIAVSIIPAPGTQPERAEKLRAFKKDGLTSLDGKTFLSILTEVCEVMGVTSPNEVPIFGKSTFSSDVFKIELSGPDRENLSIIDIPGIFRNPTEGVTTKADIELVKNMVRSYIRDERTIILAVVPANVDIATQEILRMAEEADPDGQRTLGVLTKPDLVDAGGEQNIIDLVNGKRNKLALGYCIVRNRGQKELESDSCERGSKERQFFDSEPWSVLDKDRVGVDSLKARLQQLLAEIIKREFPKIRTQMEKRLIECKRTLKVMGADRDSPEHQRRFLEGIAANFETITNDALGTAYYRHKVLKHDQKLRLPTLVGDRSDRFASDIRQRGHTVSFGGAEDSDDEDGDASPASKTPTEDDEQTDDEEQLLTLQEGEDTDDSRFEESDDSDSLEVVPKSCKYPKLASKSCEYPELADILHNEDYSSAPDKRKIIQWIKEEYRKARGFSLEVMDPNILPMLWQQQSKNWKGIALGFINDVITYVHDFLCRLLAHVCPDIRTREGLLSFIMDDLLGKYRRAIKQVKFILKVERYGTLLTKNHYFGDTLGKIREERRLAALKPLEFNVTDGKNGNPPRKCINVTDLTKIVPMANLDHAVEDIHAVLRAYYKVAQKRFVDTVCAQGMNYYLLTGNGSPLKILTPMFISSMTNEQLEEIAGEDMASRRKRQGLKEQILALEQGKKVLRG